MPIRRSFAALVLVLGLRGAALAESAGNDVTGGRSYEGYLSERGKPPLLLWLDLKAPAGDGKVEGTYVYKQSHGELALSGTLLGTALSLTETDTKGKATGQFNLTMSEDGLVGNWQDARKRKSLKAVLYRTDPSLRERSRKAVQRLLREERKGWESEAKDVQRKVGPLQITFAQNGIVSAWYQVTARDEGGTDSELRIFHTLRLGEEKEDEINVWDEIDREKQARFQQYLREKAKPQWVAWKRQTSDADLAAAFNRRENSLLSDEDRNNEEKLIRRNLQRYLAIDAPPPGSDPYGADGPRAIAYFEPDHLVYRVENVFQIQPAPDEMANEPTSKRKKIVKDFTYQVEVPFDELKSFLKAGSMLQRLPGKAKPLSAFVLPRPAFVPPKEEAEGRQVVTGVDGGTFVKTDGGRRTIQKIVAVPAGQQGSTITVQTYGWNALPIFQEIRKRGLRVIMLPSSPRWVLPAALRNVNVEATHLVEAVAAHHGLAVSYWQGRENLAVLHRPVDDAYLQGLRNDLLSSDASRRIQAAWRARWLRDARLVPALVSAAMSTDRESRRQALRTLSRYGWQTALVVCEAETLQLLDRVRGSPVLSVEEVEGAATAADTAPSTALPAESPDLPKPRNVIGTPHEWDILLNRAIDLSADGRRAYLNDLAVSGQDVTSLFLALLGAEVSFETLEDMARDEWDARMALLKLLRTLQGRNIPDYLEKLATPLLADPNDDVRSLALDVVAELPRDRAIPLIATVLDDGESEVRENAYWLLAEMGGDEVVKLFAQTIAQGDSRDDHGIAAALFRLEPDEIAKLLKKTLAGNHTTLQAELRRVTDGYADRQQQLRKAGL